MTWQGENKDSCQVTIGVDVTCIEVSITVILSFHSNQNNAVARDFSGHSHRVLVSSLFMFTLRIYHFFRCVPPHAQLSLQPRDKPSPFGGIAPPQDICSWKVILLLFT